MYTRVGRQAEQSLTRTGFACTHVEHALLLVPVAELRRLDAREVEGWLLLAALCARARWSHPSGVQLCGTVRLADAMPLVSGCSHAVCMHACMPRQGRRGVHQKQKSAQAPAAQRELTTSNMPSSLCLSQNFAGLTPGKLKVGCFWQPSAPEQGGAIRRGYSCAEPCVLPMRCRSCQVAVMQCACMCVCRAKAGEACTRSRRAHRHLQRRGG